MFIFKNDFKAENFFANLDHPLAKAYLEELDQNAAGPELEKAAELDNEATLEKKPDLYNPDIDNKDIYGDDEEAAEDVG